MNRKTIKEIDSLRFLGMTTTEISRNLAVSVNTVKSHIRRHPDVPGTLICLYCGQPVIQNEGRKAKKFCSDRCRISYWNQKRKDKEKSDGEK